MHAITSLLYMFQWYMQANRKYIYIRKKHPFACCPAAKAPKRSEFRVTNIWEKSAKFSYGTSRASTSNSWNNFTNLGYAAKIFVPVETIIPWCNQEITDSTETDTFGKEPKLAKFLRELKLTPVSYNKKKCAGFSWMSVMRNLLCFGRFAAGYLVNGCFFLTHYNISNWLANACTLKACD